MEVMMRDQLQKASAVLAVMDYTQLNSKADEEVRKELNAIADVSVGRLFVLVNKFDQKISVVMMRIQSDRWFLRC